MVSEWQEAIINCTELTPILHYGLSCFDQVAWDRIKPSSRHPWHHVIITTKETLQKRWYPPPGSPQFWGTPNFSVGRLVIDEGYRYRTSGTPLGKSFNVRSGKVHFTKSGDPAIIWATQLESLEPDTKWMLTATPMVNSLTDLRWVYCFLQWPEWLSQNLPPDTFAHKDNVEMEMWMPNPARRSKDGNGYKMIFTPRAAPFQDHEAHGSYVHCTTKAWDCYIAPDYNVSAKL